MKSQPLKLLWILIAIVLIGIPLVRFAGGYLDERERAQVQREAEAEIEEKQKSKEAAAAEFGARKPQILSEIQASIDSGHPRAALARASAYPVPDPDLAHLVGTANRAIEDEELKHEAELPLAARARLFAALASREPGNPSYVARAREFASSEAAAAQDAAPGHADPRTHPCYGDGSAAANRVLVNRSSPTYAQDPAVAMNAECARPAATDPTCHARCLAGFRNRLVSAGESAP